MKTSLMLATAIGLMLPVAAHAEDIVLKFWDNQQTESGLSQYQQEAVKSFEAANPGIKVEVTTIPYPEYQQRLLTAVQGGNAPDVSTVDQIWVAAFAAAGAIDPLDDLAKGAGITADTFFPGAWASANYDGKLWGIPFNVDVWQFSFYNDDLLKGAGVDPASIATFEGLKAAGEKLTGNGKYGIGLFAHKGEDTVVVMDSFIFSNGGKVLNDDGVGDAFGLAQGIVYAMSAGADVINLSLSSLNDSEIVRKAIEAAREAGVVVVAATGNAGTAEPKEYPAAIDGVIAVAATGPDDHKSDFSNYGAEIRVSAPGTEIESSLPGGTHGVASGTSMAAPFIAAAVALAVERFPDFSPAQIEERILSSTTVIDSLNPDYAGQLGAGRLDLVTALGCTS